jgi:hypothetical protein
MYSLVRLLPVMAVAVAAAVSAPRAASAVECGGSRTRVATNIPGQTTTSMVYSDVTGAVATAGVPDGACIIIEFTAQVRARTPGVLLMRVTLDDEATGDPEVTFYTSANKPDLRTATFHVRNVTRGSRTAKVQFLSANGAAVSLGKGVMIVNYPVAF